MNNTKIGNVRKVQWQTVLNSRYFIRYSNQGHHWKKTNLYYLLSLSLFLFVSLSLSLSAKTRLGALESLRQAFSSRVLCDFLIERRLTISDCLERSLKKGETQQRCVWLSWHNRQLYSTMLITYTIFLYSRLSLLSMFIWQSICSMAFNRCLDDCMMYTIYCVQCWKHLLFSFSWWSRNGVDDKCSY